MVRDMRWRAHRLREKVRRCCKDGQYAGYAVSISASATLPGRLDALYVCDRAHGYRGEPNCQSIAGPPIDKAIGMLIAEQMTPTAVELALEIRREIEVRYEEADRLRCRAIERAQIEADLAQRRFMLVDPNNRLVADTLEGEWNEKLRVFGKST